jgi:hypothetical protein
MLQAEEANEDMFRSVCRGGTINVDFLLLFCLFLASFKFIEGAALLGEHLRDGYNITS